MLKQNLIANYLGQGWTALMGFIFIPFYVKYLGIEAYGLIGLYAVLQVWLGLLDVGMTPTLSREMSRFLGGGKTKESLRDLLRSIEIIGAIVALTIVIVSALGSNWIAVNWLKNEKIPISDVAQAFTIMGVVTALKFIEGLYRSAIIGLQIHVIFNLINCFLATIRSVGALLILIWFSPTITAFFYWQALVSLLSLIIMGLIVYRRIPTINRFAVFSINELSKIRNYAIGMTLISLVTLTLTQLDKILLTGLLSLAELGILSILISITSIISMLSGPIITTYSPKFMELVVKKNPKEIIRHLQVSTQIIMVVILSFSMPIIFYPEIVLKFFINEELNSELLLLFRLMIVSNLILCPVTIIYNLTLAYGWTRLPIIVNTISIFIIVPAILYVVPTYGAIGSTLIYIFLHTGYLFGSCLIVMKRYHKKDIMNWYKNSIFFPVATATVAAYTLSLVLKPQENVVMNMAILLVVALVTFILTSISSSQLKGYLKEYLIYHKST